MIEIQQPHNKDIVGNNVLISGIAGNAFEATFNYRITEGHDEVTGSFMAGSGSGGHGQFQIVVDISNAAFKLPTAFVQLFMLSAKDGSEFGRVSKSVILGSVLIPGYNSFLRHQIKPDETLWSISKTYYGSGQYWWRIFHATPSIENPEIIFPGTFVRVPVE